MLTHETIYAGLNPGQRYQARQLGKRYGVIRSGEHNGFHLSGPGCIGNFEVKQKVRDGEAHYYHGEYLDRAIDAVAAMSKEQR